MSYGSNNKLSFQRCWNSWHLRYSSPDIPFILSNKTVFFTSYNANQGIPTNNLKQKELP